MKQPEVIKIDDVEYVRKDTIKSISDTTDEIRIVILQRGWVVVGYWYQDGPNCTLTRAAVIRIWGTTKGLGEIAYDGPTPKTVLDKCPDIHFHELTVIQSMNVVREKWIRHLLGS